MSAEIDLKSLWNKQTTSDMPDTNKLIERAERWKKIIRNKIIGLNVILIATIVFITYVVINIDHLKATTIIGTTSIAIAIVSYLMVSNQIIPILFKTNPEASSHEYLEQMIKIKRKQDFLNKVMINIYFGLLTLGLFLYSLQFSERMTFTWALTYYTISFGFLAFAWFYLSPKGKIKQQQSIIDLIEKLEKVNRQFDAE
jgi:cobalamin synthase